MGLENITNDPGVSLLLLFISIMLIGRILVFIVKMGNNYGNDRDNGQRGF